MGAGRLSVVLAGAQTGGHLYPAVAVGRALAASGADVTLVGSGEAIEATVLKGSGLATEILKVGKLKGMGMASRLRGLASLPAGFARAAAMLRRLRPNVVVGFGGYTTGPLVLAAALAGIPTAVCEENSVPGLTNRVLARFVREVFAAYDLPGLKARSVTRTGTPVRPEVLAVPGKAQAGDSRNVLVFGGSQGSRFLNERMPPVLAAVARRVPGLRVLHQTGSGNEDAAKAAWRAAGLEADVREYLDPIADAYRWADFVVARSGAGTVAEVSAIGIPALFVPFAAAADNHQVANARPIVEAGGGMMVEERDFDGAAVAARLADLLGDTARLRAMAEASRASGVRDALDRVVAGIERLAGRGPAGNA